VARALLRGSALLDGGVTNRSAKGTGG
jgi:hypothetical protein